jgi:diguanylate cyclase (GGDEF)-like protein
MNEVLDRMTSPEHTFDSAALILVDVDGMKGINDSHGHLVGDKVLRALSSALSADGAIVSRFGGDEFLVVLPNADEARAEAYIRGLRRLLQLTRVTNDDGRLVPVGVSAGAALFPQEGDTTQEVIRLADERMYEIKSNTEPRIKPALFYSEDPYEDAA